MAITVHTSASNTTTNLGSIVITKPSGLIVGDQMVAALGSDETSGQFNTPSGWTLISRASALTDKEAVIFFKVADSADVAASNFTFTHSSGTANLKGGIMRVSGLDTVNIPEAEATAFSSANNTSYNFAVTETLRVPINLVVIVSSGENAVSSSGGFTSHNTTPSATYTNLFDATNTGAGTVVRADYAVIDNDTTITNIAVTASVTQNELVTAFAAFRDLYPTTGTNATFNVRPAFFNQNGSAGTNGTNATFNTEPIFPSQSGKGTSPTQWTNETKPTTTWTNET